MKLRSRKLGCIFLLFIAFGLLGCTKHTGTSADVRDFFAKHKIGDSPDYAVVKNGNDYLAVVFGMADDRSACMDLIKPYNENPNLSTLPGIYSCIPLNN